jgi:hypothetical protein
MLSSLSKLADRSFILGEFLPSLLFIVALLLLFHDQQLPKALIEAVTKKDVVVTGYLLLAVWASAVLLLILNVPLYRFLEGYEPFPGWLADWPKTRNRRQWQSSWMEMTALHDAWVDQGDKFPGPSRDRYERLRSDFVKRMPPREKEILATRFGNAIRAFEVYPSELYGADGVVIWPRLTSVMPKAFVEQIEDIRSQVDFLVNCCFFSATIAFLGFFRTIYSAIWQDRHTTAGFLCAAGGAAILAYYFYQWAVTRVPAWGELVMSAFDCYLPELAEQLGFEPATTDADRKTFWLTFSQQVNYGRDPYGRTPFRIEKWKKAQSKGVNKELECGAKTQDGKAEESGNNNDSEVDPKRTEL